MPAYETKQYLKYPLPDVLKIADGAAAAEAAAVPFRAAGMGVDVVPVQGLVSLPAPQWSVSLNLADDVLTLRSEESELRLPWDGLALLVIVQYALEWKTGIDEQFVHFYGDSRVRHYQWADLYARVDGKPRAARLDQRALDYAGLGPLKRADMLDNWLVLIGELKRRAPGMAVDDALVRNRPRETKVDGRLLSVLVADEPVAVRETLGKHAEFYTALRAWQVIAGGETASPAERMCAVKAESIDAGRVEPARPEAGMPAAGATPALPEPERREGATRLPDARFGDAPQRVGAAGPHSAAGPPPARPARAVLKAFCGKCFKEVEVAPGSKCPHCGTDVSEGRKRAEHEAARREGQMTLLEQIGIVCLAIGAMVTFIALRGAKGALRAGTAFSFGLFAAGPTLLALGGALYWLGRRSRKGPDLD